MIITVNQGSQQSSSLVSVCVFPHRLSSFQRKTLQRRARVRKLNPLSLFLHLVKIKRTYVRATVTRRRLHMRALDFADRMFLLWKDSLFCFWKFKFSFQRHLLTLIASFTQQCCIIRFRSNQHAFQSGCIVNRLYWCSMCCKLSKIVFFYWIKFEIFSSSALCVTRCFLVCSNGCHPLSNLNVENRWADWLIC